MDRYKDRSLSPKERAMDLTKRLSLREKVGQLNQRLYGFKCYERKENSIEIAKCFKDEVEKWGGLGTLYGLFRADPWADKDYSSGLTGEIAIKTYNEMQKYVIEHSRFGIPMLMSSECPHGHQALDGYLLPVNLAVGATYNPELAESGFEVVGEQLLEMGVDFALTSMLDVLRDPRWGRSEECYGEDPFLSSNFSAAVTKGLRKTGIEVVSKHFCAQGETTGGVNASAARIGERELREIHFPPMKSAVKAGTTGVMAAYNEIDGVPCHANEWLLDDVLRKEFGFDGIIMADGVAVDRLDVLTDGDLAENAALALNAGVQISLWDESFSKLEEAVKRGLVSEEKLDEAVAKVLEVKFARGLFENPYIEEKALTNYNDEIKYPQSLEIARQSAVLLKNDGILPLDKSKEINIAVIGPNADEIYRQLGDYTPPLRDGIGTTVLKGIRDEFTCPKVNYSVGCNICDEDTSLISEAKAFAEKSDVVILALGGSSSRFSGAKFDTNGAAVLGDKLQMDCGEGVDSSCLELPGVQNELAEAVFSVGKPVISVIISGRPHAIPEIAEKSKALLWSFYPGPWGGKAVAEILSGKINPSGCLPVSIPRTTGQLPVYYNARDSYEKMHYRDCEDSPLYPFGYGLNYTSFKAKVNQNTDKLTIDEINSGRKLVLKCEVENTGNTDGFAVLQLYIHGHGGSIVRRCKELKNFKKIWLKVGEKKDVTLELDKESLSVWNRRMVFTPEKCKLELILEESGKELYKGELDLV